MDFSLDLRELNDLSIESADDGSKSLGYHLHTIWTNSVDATTGSNCGPALTGNHYDPTFKCGGASQAKNDPQCNNANYRCSDGIENCERGDLSGKYGSLSISSDGTASKSYTGDNFGAKIQDYVEDNLDIDPKKWSSIVFHDNNADGARVLCCKIVEA